MTLRSRYPGVQPFSKEDRSLFFGRRQSVEELGGLLRLEKLVVLYGKSGLGKSSVINAGLVPAFEALGYDCRLFRFGAAQAGGPDPLAHTLAALGPISPEMAGLPPSESLWASIKAQQRQGTKRFLLVFDQFEELFTYPELAVDGFQQALATALFAKIPQQARAWMEAQGDGLDRPAQAWLLDPPEIKVLFAIRSDRMSLMNLLSKQLPGLLRHCYELQPLSRQEAEEAILMPAYAQSPELATPPFDYDDETLDRILDFLTEQGTQQVEGFTLQVVCQRAEAWVREHAAHAPGQRMPVVTLAQLGSLEAVYANHYDNLMGHLGSEGEKATARKLVEESFIFAEEGRRIGIDEVVLTRSMGIPQSLLSKLVDTHLVRVERNSTGGRTYELSHDALVDPILQARARRLAQAAQRRRRRITAALSGAGILLLLLLAVSLLEYGEDSNAQEATAAYQTLEVALGSELLPQTGTYPDSLGVEKGDKPSLQELALQAQQALEVAKKKEALSRKMVDDLMALRQQYRAKNADDELRVGSGKPEPDEEEMLLRQYLRALDSLNGRRGAGHTPDSTQR
jgi:hypothetical protein